MKKQLNFNQFPEMQEMHMKILDLTSKTLKLFMYRARLGTHRTGAKQLTHVNKFILKNPG